MPADFSDPASESKEKRSSRGPLPPYLSQGCRYTGGMKIVVEKDFKAEEVIATFGEACLVRADDRIELRGGSMSDRIEALDWMSIFMPDEVVRLRK